MAVPYTFGTATSAIPLSQLDSNFATAITIGNTAVQLGNTITTLSNVTLTNATITSLANVTLSNATISSLSTPITAAQGGTGLATLTSNNVVLGNGTGNVQLVAPGTSGNVLVSNGTTWSSSTSTANVSSVTGILPIANGGTALSSTPANGALDIGNGTGFTRTTLTAGSGVTITNGAGAITIAASGGSNTPIGTDLAATDYTLTMPTALASTISTPVMQAVNLDGTKQLMLIGGNSSLQAVVWDGSAFGTMVLVRSGNFFATSYSAVVAISSTSVLVSSLTGSSTALETVVLSISGTTITVNTAVATTLATSSSLILANTRFVTCGSSYVLNYDNGTNPCFRAITVSGTTPTIGSELALSSGDTNYPHSYAYTSSVLLSLSTDASVFYAQPISVSGTTLTSGTRATKSISSSYVVSGVLSSGRVAVAYPFSGTQVECSIVSVTTTVASISSASQLLTSGTQRSVMQIFGTQAFILAGITNISQLGVLTDTAGVASVGTPLATGLDSRMVGYLSTGKVFLQSTVIGDSFYTQYGISSGAPVLEKSFQTGTSQSTIVVQTFAGNTFYNPPLSGLKVSGSNSTPILLRTSTGKTAPPCTTNGLAFCISIDGSNVAKTQQAPFPAPSAYNDGISTSIAWGIFNLQSTTTTTLLVRKITLS